MLPPAGPRLFRRAGYRVRDGDAPMIWAWPLVELSEEELKLVAGGQGDSASFSFSNTASGTTAIVMGTATQSTYGLVGQPVLVVYVILDLTLVRLTPAARVICAACAFLTLSRFLSRGGAEFLCSCRFLAGEDGLSVREAMSRAQGMRGPAAEAGDPRPLLGRHGGEAPH
jgi:hypothetical protein